jgi:hypothetical protein
MSLAPALARRGYGLGGAASRARAVWSAAAAGIVGAVVVSAIAISQRRVMKVFAQTKEGIARETVTKYAYEAMPSWQRARPDAVCPARLADLNEWMNNKDIRDPWGRDYGWHCHSSSGVVTRFAVTSAGPDETFGTRDDITSIR